MELKLADSPGHIGPVVGMFTVGFVLTVNVSTVAIKVPHLLVILRFMVYVPELLKRIVGVRDWAVVPFVNR